MKEFNHKPHPECFKAMITYIMTQGMSLLRCGFTPEQAFYTMVGAACGESANLELNEQALLLSYQAKITHPSTKVGDWQIYRDGVLKIKETLDKAANDPEMQELFAQQYASFFKQYKGEF